MLIHFEGLVTMNCKQNTALMHPVWALGLMHIRNVVEFGTI